MHASRTADYLAPMDGSATAFAPQIIGLLVGGLGASLGLTYWARSAAMRSALARVRGTVFAAVCMALITGCVVTAYFLARSLVRVAVTEPGALSPMGLLLLGVAIGLPLGLPGVVATYADVRKREIARLARGNRPATRDDRRAYAERLAAQIVEVSPHPRTLSASIAGDGGTILRLEGDIDAVEGDRLTAALRDDLEDVGFKRVEGRQGAKEWWSRV